jgi:anti-sigma B factor antagonist
MLKHVIRQSGGVTIVDLKGKITIGSGDEQLRDLVHGLLDAGQKKILLNCEGVTFIDSTGIGELVATYTKAKNRQGNLALLKLTARIQELMEITQLMTVFDVYDDEAEAVTAMGG